MCVYIYIYIYTCMCWYSLSTTCCLAVKTRGQSKATTPNLPTKIIPTKIA